MPIRSESTIIMITRMTVAAPMITTITATTKKKKKKTIKASF